MERTVIRPPAKWALCNLRLAALVSLGINNAPLVVVAAPGVALDWDNCNYEPRCFSKVADQPEGLFNFRCKSYLNSVVESTSFIFLNHTIPRTGVLVVFVHNRLPGDAF